MQPVEPDVEWHINAAQNRGLDVVEGDLEASDGVGTHAASLRRSISMAQFHRQEFVEPVDGMLADTREQVGQPGLRIYIVELRSHD